LTDIDQIKARMISNRLGQREGAKRLDRSASPLAPRVRLLRCPECDLLYRIQSLPDRARAGCERCGAILYASKRNAIERSLALYLTAFVLWIVANSFTFLTFELKGNRQPTRLITGTLMLYGDGLWELALVVFLFVIAFPLLKVLANLSVLIPISRGRAPRHAATLLRLVDVLHPWAMTEVFLLGVLVSYAKMADLATIDVGAALVAFVALIVTLIAGDTSLEPFELWEQIQPSPLVPFPGPAEQAQLVSCHLCQFVCRLPGLSSGETPLCPRCASVIHRRRPNSLERCAALLVAAAILYLPANIYPVMTVIMFGRGDPSTILGGVKELLSDGMWPLALLVFFASITVPVLKMLGLVYLLASVRRGSRARLRERTGLYRIVEAVGRWSMVDIFVLSILVAMVRLGSLATIAPGLGAISFAAVVVLTMFAAMSFDPRLIWDAAGANRAR
jgi:paraquat-inducible protein A